MEIREIEEPDRQTFLKLCESFYSSGATTRGYDAAIAEKTFKYIISKHENLWGYLLIDKDSSQAIGYALLTSYWCNEDGGNVIILDELFIDTVNRHKGYGKMLLDWAETEFKDKAVSITLEVLTTNVAAKQLYAKLGYVEDGYQVLTKRLQLSE
ncbi:MAG TPA: GNAT family N-acetyltransferase [Eubacteriales bacterium]|jgi:GNAT superfamily N-acetyltransferase|nr:GNAT family N-acetyltransferase [Clostridia bacterium]HRR89475.1 GNAT family N-acetyltransferase [Eubacteriales bacterium]HRU84584.1 GNAT family N-acetyltransferase [Eubacteriales bacterium]